MIPVYVYVPVVLLLLSLEICTVLLAKRKIETLQMALLAKRVLLREPHATVGRRQMAAGDTLAIKDKNGVELFQLDAHTACDITVRSFV